MLIHVFFKQALNPLQVRPAESQAERENKLFVGMLPKTIADDELRNIFSQFGELREVNTHLNSPKLCFQRRYSNSKL